MTAPSSERLAKELDLLGLGDLAVKARANWYHDHLSHLKPKPGKTGTSLTDPDKRLKADLVSAARAARHDKKQERSIILLRFRVFDGEFRGTDIEHDAIGTAKP
jgi:hypothetical protein